LYSVNNFKII